MSKSSYYVGIEEPTALRKDVLESAKHSVAILKSRQSINQLRRERHDKVAELQDTIADMKGKLKTLTKILPSHSKRSMPKSLKRAATHKKTEDKDSAEPQAQESKERAHKAAEKPADGTPLSDVTGVGPARIKKLAKAKIKTAEQLAQASAQDIAGATDIVPGMAQNLIDAARKRLKKAGVSFEDKPSQQSPQEQAADEMNQLESKLADIERKLNNL